MNKLLGRTVVSACFLAVAASSAFAQAPADMQARAAYGQGNQQANRPFSRPTERVEARLAYVKTALKITDAQQPQWDAYANQVRKFAQDREQRFKSRHSKGQGARPKDQQLNAIERLERAQSFHAGAITRINLLLAVEKPLYATLSPEQQKVADEVLKPRSRSRHGREQGGHKGYGRG